ncbi:MAG: Uma2 family endonuclease, partial [Nitrospinae bacterium]|nr:Uma2 family endonuclease [Nitrospinota bacterium]
KDKREKKFLYEKYGVKEYIIIDAIEQYVERFVLKEGRYGGSEVFGPQEVLRLFSFPLETCGDRLEGIDIPLWEVFEVEKVQ